MSGTMIGMTLVRPAPVRLCTGRAPITPASRAGCVSCQAEPASDKPSGATPPAPATQSTGQDENPFSLSQVVGSYAIIGLFTSALVLAGYKGFQAAQTNPEDVGVLLAPPGAALLLMATFFVYRFASKDDFDY
eukprot:jgi/Ulvmu1/6688/UM030_0019.1